MRLKLKFTAGMVKSPSVPENRKTIVNTSKIETTAEAWDLRTLGASDAHVAVAEVAHEQALDKALDLQSISIRLPKQLIEQYKLIAHFHGVGYQPLMRDVLTRFVPNALQEIMQTQMKQAIDAAASARVAPKKKAPAKPMSRKTYKQAA
jgi:predicted DNA binding CopG/RHH family protein